MLIIIFRSTLMYFFAAFGSQAKVLVRLEKIIMIINHYTKSSKRFSGFLKHKNIVLIAAQVYFMNTFYERNQTAKYNVE